VSLQDNFLSKRVNGRQRNKIRLILNKFFTNKLILWRRDLLEKLTVALLVKKFPPFFIGPEGSLHDFANELCPEPDESSPFSHVLFL